MPFIFEPAVQRSFDSIDGIENWISDEESRLTRIPVQGLIENGARFEDDEYFGSSGTFLKFNSNSIKSFCSILGLRTDLLARLESPSLVTEVLNDLISQQEIQHQFDNMDFVMDEGNDTIIGMVSRSYVSYSNNEFLKDIQVLLGSTQHIDKKNGFKFINGYSINTQTILRFTSKFTTGKISGPGGEGEDITQIGVQFRNSMVGDSSVSINYFLYRLVCANGMTVPAGSSAINRVYHSGNRNSFCDRLKKSFSEVERKIGEAGKLVEILGSIVFDPELLAKLNISNRIFNIIPGSKSKIIEEKKIRKRLPKNTTEIDRIRREAAIIGHIPEIFGGEFSKRVFDSSYRDNASMFDFVNIFTEHAKVQDIQDKIEIEESAGLLADWIAKNKKKFVEKRAPKQSDHYQAEIFE